MEIISRPSVNMFAMLSGYLGWRRNKFNTYRFLELLSIIFFYCAVFTAIFAILSPGVFSSMRDIAISLVPALDGRYWYITCYIPIILFQPFINKGIEVLSEKQHKMLCILLFITFSVMPNFLRTDFFMLKNGYSFLWLLVCYIIGAYLKRYPIENKKVLWIMLWGSFLIMFVLKNVAFFVLGKDTRWLISQNYTSPFIFVAAVSLICLLCKGNVKKETAKKWTKRLSNAAFDVYLVHCHYLIMEYIIASNFKRIADVHPVWIVLLWFNFVICIYLIGWLCAVMRNSIYKICYVDNALKYMSEKINIILDDIF